MGVGHSPESGRVDRLRLLRPARLVLAVALVAQLPAELISPILVAGPLALTNLELTAYLLAACWLASLAARHLPRPRLSRPAAAVLVVGLAVGVAATAGAMYSAELSAKVLLRIAAAAVAGAALAQVAVEDRGWRVLAPVALAVVLATAAMGLVEHAAGVAASEVIFGAFREEPVILPGGAVRASATLIHPNVAGWLWGVAAVACLAVASLSTNRWRIILIGCSLLLLAGLALSFSRGALFGTAAASLLAAWLVRGQRDRLAQSWPAASPPPATLRPTTIHLAAMPLLAAPLALVIGIAASPLYLPRLTAETPVAWLQATIAAPSAATVAALPAAVQLTIRNDGSDTWRSTGQDAVMVSYHVYELDGGLLLWEGSRSPLPHDLSPGAGTTIGAGVATLPGNGRFRMAWDLVQGESGWFPPAAEREASTLVEVNADGLGPPGPPIAQPPPSNPVGSAFSRFELWAVALDMFAERPVAGIGLDNFGWATANGWA